jgi:hypothetical protein
MWDEEEGFYYDALRMPDGTAAPMRIHSMVGIIPVLPAAFVPEASVQQSLRLAKHVARFLAGHGLSAESFERSGEMHSRAGAQSRLLSVVSTARLKRLLGELLSEDAFLSPFGLRGLSRRHLEHPFRVSVDGVESLVDYEPGESRSGLFGGNSNWRGPVWFPLNYLVIESLSHWDEWFGGDVTVEHPTGSGRQLSLGDVARDLARRLVAIWLPGPDGRRPVFGSYAKLADDPEWRDLLPFHEYFHGDSGAGLGASHQTGWTGLIAHLLCRGGLLDESGPGTLSVRRALLAAASSPDQDEAAARPEPSPTDPGVGAA